MHARRGTAPTRQAVAYLHDTRRGRASAPREDLPHRLPLRRCDEERGLFCGLPLPERVADLLADAMLAIFEALEVCETERADAWDAAPLETRIRATYDQLNGLMKTITD
jgi:hypothetical protein